MRSFNHFSWHQRLELYKYLYIEKLSIKIIAEKLNFHISNIYREINRGMCESIDSNYKVVNMYSPEIAQKNYETNRKNCGRKFKLQKNSYSMVTYEHIILNKDYSPRACLAYIHNNRNKYSNVDLINYLTIYRYIYKKRFDRLSMKHLAYNRNRFKHMQIKRQKRASIGTSIEYRDINVLSRKEFGHWEMDSLEGAQNSKKAILNITERKTRKCILFVINKKDPNSVVNCLNALQIKYKDKFKETFKSITVDNGVEFSDFENLQKSLFDDKKRTMIYYCHSYSPHERGSNENLNRLLRRKIKKGSNFDLITDEELKRISLWVNYYPRKILNWKSSEYWFNKEMAKL